MNPNNFYIFILILESFLYYQYWKLPAASDHSHEPADDPAEPSTCSWELLNPGINIHSHKIMIAEIKL